MSDGYTEVNKPKAWTLPIHLTLSQALSCSEYCPPPRAPVPATSSPPLFRWLLALYRDATAHCGHARRCLRRSERRGADTFEAPRGGTTLWHDRHVRQWWCYRGRGPPRIAEAQSTLRRFRRGAPRRLRFSPRLHRGPLERVSRREGVGVRKC
jgi:hypothetical protein